MEQITPTKALMKYFNTDGDPEGYQKVGAGAFAKEIKTLDPEEKIELATLAAAELGVELKDAKVAKQDAADAAAEVRDGHVAA